MSQGEAIAVLVGCLMLATAGSFYVGALAWLILGALLVLEGLASWIWRWNVTRRGD